MPQSLVRVYLHIVFSTKDRKPYLSDPCHLEKAHGFLKGTLDNLKCPRLKIGGVADHVHLLVGLKATHCLADVLRELKKSSSVWVHEQIRVDDFAWQEGYAAFTVSATARPAVREYIANQEEHHRQKSYRQELVEMLERAAIEYDPAYLD